MFYISHNSQEELFSLIIFSHTAKNHFPSPHCLFLRYLSKLMAYFAVLDLGVESVRTPIYQIHQQPNTHTHTPFYSTSNFSCQSPSQINFFSSLVGALEKLPGKSNFCGLQCFVFPVNNCHSSFSVLFHAQNQARQ